jgi:hypothetical protein
MAETALGWDVNVTGSKVGVASAEHRGKPRHFHLPALLFARLFEMPVVADFFQSSFAVDLLLKPTQGLLDRFTLLQPDFSQNLITSSLLSIRIPQTTSARFVRFQESRR